MSPYPLFPDKNSESFWVWAPASGERDGWRWRRLFFFVSVSLLLSCVLLLRFRHTFESRLGFLTGGCFLRKSWFTGDDSAFSGFTVRLLKGGTRGQSAFELGENWFSSFDQLRSFFVDCWIALGWFLQLVWAVDIYCLPGQNHSSLGLWFFCPFWRQSGHVPLLDG